MVRPVLAQYDIHITLPARYKNRSLEDVILPRTIPGGLLDILDVTLYRVMVYNLKGVRMPTKKQDELSCCPPKPVLKDRRLLSPKQASDLMGLFKILANDTRLRLLHALVRSEDLCVTDLAEALGMKPQAVSNQLQRLVDRGILGSTRNGNNVHYSIVDPCVVSLLDQGLCLMEDAGGRRMS
jgi:DNA-binding transcriptional ArsR family regulator